MIKLQKKSKNKRNNIKKQEEEEEKFYECVKIILIPLSFTNIALNWTNSRVKFLWDFTCRMIEQNWWTDSIQYYIIIIMWLTRLFRAIYGVNCELCKSPRPNVYFIYKALAIVSRVKNRVTSRHSVVSHSWGNRQRVRGVLGKILFLFLTHRESCKFDVQ